MVNALGRLDVLYRFSGALEMYECLDHGDRLNRDREHCAGFDSIRNSMETVEVIDDVLEQNAQRDVMLNGI